MRRLVALALLGFAASESGMHKLYEGAPARAATAGKDAKHPTQKRSWHEGLDGVKVLRPGDANLQGVVDEIWRGQEGWPGHFNGKRFAILLTPGSYPTDFVIPVTYYTSVLGVGVGPRDVQLDAVRSINGSNTHATNNFWRSVEGVTLRAKEVLWAVSQGAPIRRSIFNGNLWLSDHDGYSSGGFIADVSMNGTLMAGLQQQWFFRNMDMPGGIFCPTGWNYVFSGVTNMADETYVACEGAVPGKVNVIGSTPRVAEKPYLVEEAADHWKIYVPMYNGWGTAGPVHDHAKNAALKLDVDREVFVARQGDTAEVINAGIRGKKGLLLTPGVYELDKPITVTADSFVVLGIGFATLVATHGLSALEVVDGIRDVRIAGLILEAGTLKTDKPTAPLLRWGGVAAPKPPSSNRTATNSSAANSTAANSSAANSTAATSTAAPTITCGAQDTVCRRRLAAVEGKDAGGVASDIFARVGSFHYRGCPVVRADTMVEVNSHDVVLDNLWLWHADHDDCGTDPGMSLDTYGKSDECFTEHALVVNGDNVTAYGTAAEHIVNGDMVSWRGDHGEAYFFQSELPYHNEAFSTKGFVAYSVAPNVTSHRALGMGVYIIGGKATNVAAYILPPAAQAKNLMTVVIVGETSQFPHTVCIRGADGKEQCFAPEQCAPEIRCLIKELPPVAAGVAPQTLFLDPGRTRGLPTPRPVSLLSAAAAALAVISTAAGAAVWRSGACRSGCHRYRDRSPVPTSEAGRARREASERCEAWPFAYSDEAQTTALMATE